MIQFLTQMEKWRVERYKWVRAVKRWDWIVIGFVNAGTSEEARKKGREALADKTCILRAIQIGKEPRP
jgi:hypothetical protein